MSNDLASAVASYTPRLPVSPEQADVIRKKASSTLHALAEEIGAYLRSLPNQSGEELLPKEEEVIIITSPPP